MTTMSIKDPEVHRLAVALARKPGISATRAVRQALEETLRDESTRRNGLAARLLALSDRSLAVQEPVPVDVAQLAGLSARCTFCVASVSASPTEDANPAARDRGTSAARRRRGGASAH